MAKEKQEKKQRRAHLGSFSAVSKYVTGLVHDVRCGELAVPVAKELIALLRLKVDCLQLCDGEKPNAETRSGAEGSPSLADEARELEEMLKGKEDGGG